MIETPENSQPSESNPPTPSQNSVTSSAASSPPNPFQGPGAEDAWRRLRATRGNIVRREEMIRRVQQQARREK